MTSNSGNKPLRATVAAVALACCGWTVGAAPLVSQEFAAQGIGCFVPAEGSAVGPNTLIKLPGSHPTDCPGTSATDVGAKRGSFLAGLSSHVTEEFPSDKAEFSNGYKILSTLATISTNNGAGGLRYFDDPADTINGRWDTTQELQVAVDQNGNSTKSGGWFSNGFFTAFIDVTMDADQDAVGFYLTDYGDFGDPATLEFFRDGNSLGSRQISGTSSADGSVGFFGVYTSEKFDQFRIKFNQNADCLGGDDFECDLVGLDRLTVGIQQRNGSIPEPGSLALIGLGLLAARRASARKSR